MHFVEDPEDTGVIVLQCTESEVRFLNAPKSMLSTAPDDILTRLVWFYTPGNGALLRLENADACAVMKLRPVADVERRLLALLWHQVKKESVLKEFPCA